MFSRLTTDQRKLIRFYSISFRVAFIGIDRHELPCFVMADRKKGLRTEPFAIPERTDYNSTIQPAYPLHDMLGFAVRREDFEFLSTLPRVLPSSVGSASV